MYLISLMKWFLALAYPFACFIVLCVVLLFSDDHHIIDVSRSERFLRSIGER